LNNESPNDPIAIGLAALAETLGDPRRAQRFLDLTGIGTRDLRERAGEPALLIALFDFLEAHDPDLLQVSEGLGLRADQLTGARRCLQGDQSE
jgi:hypothetical protein